MTYSVAISRRAQKELAELPRQAQVLVQVIVVDLITALAANPCRPKLHDGEGWRIHVGNYRILYDIDDPARSIMVVHTCSI